MTISVFQHFTVDDYYFISCKATAAVSGLGQTSIYMILIVFNLHVVHTLLSDLVNYTRPRVNDAKQVFRVL